MAVCVLVGCAAGPAVKDVTAGDSTQYWVLDPSNLPHDVPPADGCLRVQVVIDSDGKIAESKVLAVMGPGFAAWIPKFLPQLRYIPAPGNTTRTPIRTILRWTFNSTVSTESSTTAVAGMKAKLAAGPTADDEAWRVKCEAEMDKQMGINPK